MEASESLHKLSSIEAGPSLRELLVLTQMVEQLTSIEEVHHEIQLGRGLECVVKLHDEWTVDFFKNVSLGWNNETRNS